jgi:hypothetical protein
MAVWPQPLDKLLQPFAIATDRERLAAWTHVHVKAVLRHVNADK